MIYELVLTDQCTRSCSFCWVQQTSHVESKDNVLKFIDEVKKSNQQEFVISLFGGEPLLNIEGIKLVVEQFANDPRCKSLEIATNGDLIPKIINQDWVKVLKWHISAYDIFEDATKYQQIATQLGLDRTTIQYTFTENDIHLVHQFQKLARECVHASQYRIVFSHSKMSWNSISQEKLHQLVFGVAMNELELVLNDFPKVQSCTMLKPLKNIIGKCLLDNNQQREKRFCCLDTSKRVFYNGNFIGPCLLAKDIQADHRCIYSIDPKCIHCDYDRVCSRSCFCELLDSQIVDDKLCIIEKAQFDAVSEFASKHQYSRIWREIIRRIEAIDEI